MKIFDLYETKDVKVEDVGLKNYINISEKLMIKSHGRERERFSKTKVHVVELLINALGAPGHRGKKHKIMTHWATGKWTTNALTVLRAFKIIEEKTKQNPVQVLVKAIENAAPRDEITTIEYGGARYPQAVDVSPTRRLNLAIKNITHGAYDKAFGKKAAMAETLAAEIISASNNTGESFAIGKRNETEKMTDSAR
jgi:small subunit ribosomal protein S7